MPIVKPTPTKQNLASTKIKICGITSVEDALAAMALGADALGFVFYPPSARNVKPEQVAQIIRQLPPFVTAVALFVNEEIDVIVKLVKQTGINTIQLHGNESPAFCQTVFERSGCSVIKAIRITDTGECVPSNIDEYTREKGVKALLLDTFSSATAGGTGERFDWNHVKPLQSLSLPLILAGGLTADNVEKAIKATAVYAVDVSGGVEASKGIKDHDKMRKFIDNVKHHHCG